LKNGRVTIEKSYQLPLHIKFSLHVRIPIFLAKREKRKKWGGGGGGGGGGNFALPN